MTYTPTEWETGDTITAAGLNKIEQGIANAGSALICTLSYNSDLGAQALDKTLQEIYDAYISGVPVYIKYIYGTLGPSGTGDYESDARLAPITYIYGYNYMDAIRICASWPYNIGAKGGKGFLRSPGVLNLSASSMSDYPQWYSTVYVPDTYVTVV